MDKWHSLTSDIQESHRIPISRCYFYGIDREVPVESYHLCGFCDTSLRAYAAVVYLLIKTNTQRFVKFVAAKTRVSPIHGQTIPRLELLSAQIDANVTCSLEQVLPLDEPLCFSDSKVALFWIQGINKEWKPFVQNRMIEIRKLLPVNSWRHCPGQLNPADIPSRGATLLELVGNSLWHDGPSWLRGMETDEPTTDMSMPNECLDEMRVKDQQAFHSLLTTEEPRGIGQIIFKKVRLTYQWCMA